MGVVEVGVVGAGPPFSLTMLRQEDSLSSKAPTFRSKSPTMFKADILAEGVKVWLCLGDDLLDEGGVSIRTSFSPFDASAACLLESGLLLLNVLLLRSNFNCIEDLSLSGGDPTGSLPPPPPG